MRDVSLFSQKLPLDCSLVRAGEKPQQSLWRPSGDVTWVWQNPINIVSGLGLSHNCFLSQKYNQLTSTTNILVSSALKLSVQCNKLEQDIGLSVSCLSCHPAPVHKSTQMASGSGQYFSHSYDRGSAACRDFSVPGLFPEVATCKLPVTNISPLSRQLWSCSVFDAWVRIYDGWVKIIWSQAPLCPGARSHIETN